SVTASEPRSGFLYLATDDVLTCQPDPPSLSLSVTLDGRDLFWFDFPGSRWNPGIPSLPPWPSELESPQEILPEAQLCKEILGVLGRTLTGVMPEARAIPEISLFPALPPVPGEPNTLVCLVENIFPPVLDITWTVAGAVVTQGVTQGPFVPTSDLTFVRLSRISVTTLEPGTVHACVVTSDFLDIFGIFWGRFWVIFVDLFGIFLGFVGIFWGDFFLVFLKFLGSFLSDFCRIFGDLLGFLGDFLGIFWDFLGHFWAFWGDFLGIFWVVF
uniref:Ig-like domain-containing protein n=1 Tax=Catharus ustulatus TaxID=91951 RepID=A0A8C3URD9_CATUS